MTFWISWRLTKSFTRFPFCHRYWIWSFFAFLRFLWRAQRVTFVKLLFMEGYKWQTSYSTCKKVVKESLLSRFSWYSISFLAKWAAVHSLGTLTLSHIIATRVGLDYPVWPVFLKNSLTSAIKRLATKKDLGPFKIHRAVVDSSGSVNLPFNIRKILCTYPRKRKDMRSSNVSDRRPVIVPGWRADLHPVRRFVCLFFGWVCTARDSKWTPRSKKRISPKIDTPF